MPSRRVLGIAGLACVVVEAALAGTAGASTTKIGPNGEVLLDGKPFLPIMQWLQNPSSIQTQKAFGINTFVGDGSGGTAKDFLDTCASQGVVCAVDPSDLSVATHGSLFGWIFGDEPDLQSNMVEPATLLGQYQSLKQADPNHVALMTLTASFYSEMSLPDWMNGSDSRYYDYPKATDLVGFDIYPIYGWCRPDKIYWVSGAEDELHTKYAPGKTMYQWIECVKTSGQWCDLPDRGMDDGPYDYEVRNEVWQAVVHGAQAIGYFTHSWECPGYSQFCLSTALETELTRTNGQLTDLTGAILGASYPGSVKATDAGGGRIDVAAKQDGSKVYLFAVSLERSMTNPTISIEGLPDGPLEVYDENRMVTLKGGAFQDAFDQLGVHIYVAANPNPTGSGSGTGGGASSAGPGGGATAASGPGGGSASTAGASETSGDTGGCGCRSAGSTRRSSSALGALAIAAMGLGALRRRRRRARARY